MKVFLMSLVILSGVCAMASPIGTQVDPGYSTVNLGDSATEAVNALVYATPADLQDFISSGNVVKKVTRQNLQPGVTVYNFEREQCNLGGFAKGFCMGGANLRVILTEKRAGSDLSIEATSSIQRIR